MFMLAMSFFTWWYGQGWQQVAKSLNQRLKSTMELYSVEQLLRTLFSPWRRIISYPGSSFRDKWHAWLDNLFSRFMGFLVRIFVLLIAVLSIVVIALATIIEIILWPILPLLVPGCMVAAIVT
jgi:hypothetical protein